MKEEVREAAQRLKRHGDGIIAPGWVSVYGPDLDLVLDELIAPPLAGEAMVEWLAGEAYAAARASKLDRVDPAAYVEWERVPPNARAGWRAAIRAVLAALPEPATAICQRCLGQGRRLDGSDEYPCGDCGRAGRVLLREGPAPDAAAAVATVDLAGVLAGHAEPNFDYAGEWVGCMTCPWKTSRRGRDVHVVHAREHQALLALRAVGDAFGVTW